VSATRGSARGAVSVFAVLLLLLLIVNIRVLYRLSSIHQIPFVFHLHAYFSRCQSTSVAKPHAFEQLKMDYMCSFGN
jgi:hypothetical protein